MRVGSLGDIILEVSAPDSTTGNSPARIVTPTEFTRERKARVEFVALRRHSREGGNPVPF